MHSGATADADAACSDAQPLALSDLPADILARHVDAASLARLRASDVSLCQLVDSIAADLLARRLRECRERAQRRRAFLPKDEQPSFVGIMGDGGSMHLIGGLSCGGSDRRRSLHGHVMAGRWAAASYNRRQSLLVRASDGAVVGELPACNGGDVALHICCEAECQGDGAARDDDDDDDDDDDELIREQEEEAASRGWGWRRPTGAVSLGTGAPGCIRCALVALPEPATAVCACPASSYVLGCSGAVYSARWHGQRAARGPSSSPWTCWLPPSAALRVVELSAIASHALLRTQAGGALAYGDPADGKLGFHSQTAHVSSPRLIEAFSAARVVVAGLSAGGRHSLFLSQDGICFACGANDHGQCGPRPGQAPAASMSLPPGPLHVVSMPDACAPLVQVCAGRTHSLFLDHQGRAFACGSNDRGQCGQEVVGSALAVVRSPTAIHGLPRSVHAMDAAWGLSLFEAGGDETNGACACDGETDVDGAPAQRPLSTSAMDDEGQHAEPQGTTTGAEGTAVWLAGNVEGMNIPGTMTTVGGLRFMPSCYQWQQF